MPNKEEKKHFLKKKKDSTKKVERFIQPTLSNSVDGKQFTPFSMM